MIYSYYTPLKNQLHYEIVGNYIFNPIYANTIISKGGLSVDKIEQRKEAGAKLRELRKATKLSVFKVGQAIGMSGNYISEIERGVRPASDAALIALADLYGVDKQYLFDLYGKIHNEEIDILMQYPQLRKTIIELTSDPKITKKDVDEILTEFQLIVKNHFAKGDDS